MRRLQRGYDALGPTQQLEGLERLVVGDGGVFDAADVLQPSMLGADAGIVEAGRDGVGLDRLAVLVLQPESLRAVEDARSAAPAATKS